MLAKTDMSQVDWSGTILSKMPIWLPSLIALWAVVYTLHTLAYRAIMGWDMKSMPFWRLLKMTISGFSLNQVTPMGLVGGEPYRIMEMKPYIGLEKEDGSMFWGAGTDTDVVKANTKALLSAYNNMIKGGN